MSKYVLISLVLALSACAVGPDYQRPVTVLPDIPATSPQASAVQTEWWTEFNDATLNQLVQEALQHNQDLSAAAARVEEAAAQAGIARAQLLPALNANLGYQRGRSSEETTTPGVPFVSDVRTGNIMLGWELDLWGKLRRSNEAARAQFQASRFNRDAIQLSIAAQVAQTYFQLRAYDRQLNIAQATLRGREQSLVLQKKRSNAGLISALEFSQSQAEAAMAKAKVPQLQQAVTQTASALGVLIGRTPKALVEMTIARGKSIDKLTIPHTVPTQLPSSLLERRPDIAASEQLLIAANARIGVARAAYFPSINLTSSIGSQSLALQSLFSGPAYTWSFAGNLAAPIFNFGQTGYNVDAASARQKEALAQYKKTIQIAFKDVLDTLSAGTTSQETLMAQLTQLQAIEKAYHITKLRYNNGYSNYLDFLDAQRNLFQVELNVVDAKLNQLNSLINLYKALGGGWAATSPSH